MDRRRRGLFALLTIVAILAILYLRGSFDPLLYRFGLNHNPCTRSGGQTVCGSNVVGTPYGFVTAGSGPGPVAGRGVAVFRSPGDA